MRPYFRHVRLLKPYFQDCLMQEKAAEIGIRPLRPHTLVA
jgi:hypothetical protein